MIVVFKGVENESVLIFDAEYNESFLIQFSGILFRKIEKDTFQIEKSLNIYIKLPKGEKINKFIENFTGITDDFLNTFGETIDDAIEMIDDLVDIDGTLLVSSHGIYNDRRILLENGVNLYEDKNGKDIEGVCTYNMAKRILKRERKLGLLDIAEESGMYLSNSHDALDDAWATVSVFCLLNKLEEEQKNEKLLQSKN